jgi:hypothetical protein
MDFENDPEYWDQLEAEANELHQVIAALVDVFLLAGGTPQDFIDQYKPRIKKRGGPYPRRAEKEEREICEDWKAVRGYESRVHFCLRYEISPATLSKWSKKYATS